MTKRSSVEVLSPQQIEDLPEDAKIIGTRWVHTDKNQKKRLMSAALQGRTGKSQAQIQKEFPLEAENRLVVQGHQETDAGIRSDSPTASLLAFNLVLPLPISSPMASAACFCSGHQDHLLQEFHLMTFFERLAQSMAPRMPAELGGRSSSKL